MCHRQMFIDFAYTRQVDVVNKRSECNGVNYFSAVIDSPPSSGRTCFFSGELLFSIYPGNLICALKYA